MLAIWRQHGVDEVLREAWERGVVLTGGSAGAICWYEASVTDSWGPWLQSMRDGLGFLPGSMCPHYDGEPLRRPRYREYIANGDLPDGYAAANFVGFRWTGTELTEVVSGLPSARGWRLERTAEGGYTETEIVPRYLGES
jgi:peptidase E